MKDIEDEEIAFQTEIKFKGKIREFIKIADALKELPIDIRVEFPRDHTAGCWPIPPLKAIGAERIEEIIEGQPRFIIKGIDGGIRDPHFHEKDEIILLDRKRFQQLVKGVAGELAETFAGKANYAETLGAIRGLAEGIIIVDG